MKNILIACLLTVSLFTAGSLGRAADAGSAPEGAASKTEKKAKYMPFRGKVASVDKTAKTLTLAGKTKSRTFLLKDETRIHNDGKPAALDDVQAGALVGGRARANDAGEWEVVVLNLGIKGAKAKEKAAEPASDDSME